MSDRFEAMQIFVAICETEGFGAAARRLGLTPSGVTRAIAGLEEHLGTRLLQRTTRSVKLTDAGSRFLERSRRILADLEDAELSAQAERSEPRGLLVVAAPLLFGRMYVAPILSRLLADHRALRGELQLSDRNANLVEDGVDVAVRIGDMPDSGLMARRLGRTRRVLVASPGYLAQRGAPQGPADLATHRLIAFQTLAPVRHWSFRDRDGAPLTVPVEPVFSTNSADAALDDALGGGGITMALSYQVEAACRTGQLVEVLAPYALPGVPIRAVFPSARLLSAKVRVFIESAEAAARCWPFLRETDAASVASASLTDARLSIED